MPHEVLPKLSHGLQQRTKAKYSSLYKESKVLEKHNLCLPFNSSIKSILFFKHHIQQLKRIIQMLRNVLLLITVFTNKCTECKDLPVIKPQNYLPNKYVENQHFLPSY